MFKLFFAFNSSFQFSEVLPNTLMSPGLYFGEHDAEYTLHWAAVDWCRVAQLAQKSRLKARKEHVRLLSALRKVHLIVKIRSSEGCFLISQISTQHAVFYVTFFYLIAFTLPNLLQYASDRASGLSKLPTVFRKTNHIPFPYLRRAREMMQVFTMEFLDSRVKFDTIKGLEIVKLPAPTTKEGIKSLVNELRDRVLHTSSYA